MNGYASGEGTLSLSLLPPYKSGSSHKNRTFSHRSKFFRVRVDSILSRPRPPGKRTGSQESVPLRLEKAGVVPIHLKILFKILLDTVKRSSGNDS